MESRIKLVVTSLAMSSVTFLITISDWIRGKYNNCDTIE